MTAVRAAARFALAAALVLVVLTSALWAGLNPDLWALARLPVMCAVIAAAIRTWERTGSRHRPLVPCPCNCWCSCPAPCQRDDDGTPGWCDPCRMNIHQEA